MSKQKFYLVFRSSLEDLITVAYFIDIEKAKVIVNRDPEEFGIEEFTFEDELITYCNQLEGK